MHPKTKDVSRVSRSTTRFPVGPIGHAVILAVLLGITAGVYFQVFRHPFTDLDDGQYITGNPHVKAGLTWEGLRWAFVATKASNWHPLTWISHQADVEFFGLSPGMHHLVNLLLHLFNSALLYSVFVAMTGCRWRSSLVAAVFALHPLHVESVAWISERKDLLSTLFGLLTLIAYLRYVRKQTRRTYLPVPVLFAMALLSKPMLVSLPFVLLLLDYWPLARMAGESPLPADPGSPGTPAVAASRLLIEKIPLFALSAASSVVTFVVQEKSGTVASSDLVHFTARVTNAVAAYGSYMVKTAWPHPLAVFYPHPGEGIPTWTVVTSAACLILVTGAVLHFRKSRPALPVGWFWYLGMLVPVIGLVQAGLQGMADRYTYLPQTGLVIMIAYGVFRQDRQAAPRVVLVPIASVVILAMSVACWLQVRLWRSNESLFSHAMRHTEGNYIAYEVLGESALAKGAPEEAIRYIREALRIRPSYAIARYNLGVVYGTLGRTDDAILEYRTAVRLMPALSEAWTNLGAIYHARGQFDDAFGCYREALRLNPDDPLTHNNIGLVFAHWGMGSDAVFHFREALRLDPGYAAAAENLRITAGF